MSTSDIVQAARHRRQLHLWSAVSLVAGVAVNLWAWAAGAPLLLVWLAAFIFGANVTLVSLTWATRPRSPR